MITALALLSAAIYGTADFLGGSASRRRTAYAALVISMPVGVAVLTSAALVAGAGPTGRSLLWGAASGVAGGIGLITFYRALAKGPMSVVAPVSALASAIIPVAWGTAQGDRLDGRAIAGVLLCLLAIGLVSMESGDTGRIGTGPLLALVSGTGFGIFFVLLKEAGDGGGLWPLVAGRGTGFLVLLLILAVTRTRPAPVADPRFLAPTVVSGVLDAVANVLYFAAVQQGMLSLAAVLTSLYPAVTVLLARAVHSERLRPVQRVGMAVAVAGVALVTVG